MLNVTPACPLWWSFLHQMVNGYDLKYSLSSFIRTSFTRTSFFRTSFIRTSFIRTLFIRTSFFRTSFTRTSFFRTSFIRASFIRTSFTRTSFFRTSFIRASFIRASFIQTRFCWRQFVKQEYFETNYQIQLSSCDGKGLKDPRLRQSLYLSPCIGRIMNTMNDMKRHLRDLLFFLDVGLSNLYCLILLCIFYCLLLVIKEQRCCCWVPIWFSGLIRTVRSAFKFKPFKQTRIHCPRLDSVLNDLHITTAWNQLVMRFNICHKFNSDICVAANARLIVLWVNFVF